MGFLVNLFLSAEKQAQDIDAQQACVDSDHCTVTDTESPP
jgi:hypothetical protein